MKSTLAIGLCLCLLTFGPGGGQGGGPVIVKTNNCLNSSSDANILCTSSSSSDKSSSISSEESLVDSEAAGDNVINRNGENKRDQWTRSARIPSHQFMRFGRDHKFFRFGRAIQHKFLRFGRGDMEPQLSHKFFRFGRGDSSDYNNAEAEDGYQRMGKAVSSHQFMRFGKRSLENESDELSAEDSDYDENKDGDETVDNDDDDDISSVSKREHNFFRFGRTPAASRHSFMRFGRNPSAPSHKFMRFGRIPEHTFFRFGRSGSSYASTAFKSPTSSVVPYINSILPGPSATNAYDSRRQDDDLSSTVRINNLLQANDDVDGHSEDYNSNNDKMKRQGHMFMRFGRK